MQRRGLRSEGYQRPAATSRLAAGEPRRDPRAGEALSRACTLASLWKRRLQQWLGVAGRPDCAVRLRHLKQAVASDPEPFWAAVAASDPPRAHLVELVLKCRAEEDQLRADGREARRAGWGQWCLAQSEGGVPDFFRWIREGPNSLQSTGILVRPDGFFAGPWVLLVASEPGSTHRSRSPSLARSCGG